MASINNISHSKQALQRGLKELHHMRLLRNARVGPANRLRLAKANSVTPDLVARPCSRLTNFSIYCWFRSASWEARIFVLTGNSIWSLSLWCWRSRGASSYVQGFLKSIIWQASLTVLIIIRVWGNLVFIRGWITMMKSRVWHNIPATSSCSRLRQG